MKILIIKTGSTYPELAKKYGDFEDWVIRSVKNYSIDFIVNDAQSSQTLLSQNDYDGVIITGSHDNVTENKPWMISTGLWIKEAVQKGIPLLGICFGHQLIASALGGTVDFHPSGIEIGTVPITMNSAGKKDNLVGWLYPGFFAQASHSQTVTKLPEGAVVLASNSHEMHHIIRYGESAWGLQFHPEFTSIIMLRYLETEREALEKKGIDVNSLISTLSDTEPSRFLLRRFIEYVEAKKKQTVLIV